MAGLESVGHLQQIGGTRLVTLEDGAERGVRVVEFRTASGLEFGVLVDRAMDIAWCRYKGRSISWLSRRTNRSVVPRTCGARLPAHLPGWAVGDLWAGPCARSRRRSSRHV